MPIGTHRVLLSCYLNFHRPFLRAPFHKKAFRVRCDQKPDCCLDNAEAASCGQNYQGGLDLPVYSENKGRI